MIPRAAKTLLIDVGIVAAVLGVGTAIKMLLDDIANAADDDANVRAGSYSRALAFRVAAAFSDLATVEARVDAALDSAEPADAPPLADIAASLATVRTALTAATTNEEHDMYALGRFGSTKKVENRMDENGDLEAFDAPDADLSYELRDVLGDLQRDFAVALASARSKVDLYARAQVSMEEAPRWKMIGHGMIDQIQDDLAGVIARVDVSVGKN